ncbi:MAG: hypothetical protein GY898_30215 [Proteobacteria bacterium]|nr:hypothetical protein [Pseudomonadota bacterium]
MTRWAGLVLGIVVLGGAAAAAGEADGDEPLPGSSEACGECHATIYEQWAASGHARARRDPRFVASGRHGPAGWCIDCHSPLREEGLEAEGVGCRACHGSADGLITARHPTLRARLAHRIRKDPRLEAPEFCGDCHEFTFPLHSPAFPFTWGDEPMQSTQTENFSTGRLVRCQECHVPLGDHTMPGAHDVALIRETVTVAIDGGAVTLTAEGAEHAVPTGDPFRRFVVELCADEACAEPLALARFGRTFERTETSWRETSDTRIPPPRDGVPGSITVEVELTQPASRYRLWYYVAESRLYGELKPDDFRHLIEEGPLP